MRSFVFLKGVVFCAFASLSGEGVHITETPESSVVNSNLPWLTGTLLAPSGVTATKGVLQSQPFLYITRFSGVYDGHWHSHSTQDFYSVIPQLYIYAGITDWMEIEIVPELWFNSCEGKSSLHVGDFTLLLGFQLVPLHTASLIPAVRLALYEIFPTGRYQRLGVDKRGVDASGFGSFQTGAQLVFYNVFTIKDPHYLSVTYSLSYTAFAPVTVHGRNVYGGGSGTDGRVNPGNEFTTMLSFEYMLTRHWGLTLDNLYVHFNKDHFSGQNGVTANGGPALMGWPSSEQISFATGIEYNVSKNLGFILGVWFSAFGRNSSQFQSIGFGLGYNY